MKRYIVDFRKVNSKEDIHIEIKLALDFTGYYGKNLDALNDLIGEMPKDSYFYFLINEEVFNNKQIDIENVFKVFDDNAVDYELVFSCN